MQQMEHILMNDKRIITPSSPEECHLLRSFDAKWTWKRDRGKCDDRCELSEHTTGEEECGCTVLIPKGVHSLLLILGGSQLLILHILRSPDHSQE